ncbi:MAG: GLUG motif-containing protein [Rhizomicrobium sp.]
MQTRRDRTSLDCVAVVAAFATVLLSASGAQAIVKIGSAATANMSCANGVCEPTAKDAVLNVSDLENLLASGNATVTTTGAGVQANDIHIKAGVSWSNGSVLTLDAYRSITVWRPISVAGLAGMTLKTDDGGSGGLLSFAGRGKIVFQNLSSVLAINGTRYRLENDLKQLAYDVAAHSDRSFALAQDYDAQGDGVYPDSPIPSPFLGSFTGLGNSITDLVVVNDSDGANVGLFAKLKKKGTISNISLKNAIIRQTNLNCYIGGIAGTSAGLIENSFVSGRIWGGDACTVGGVAGLNLGAIVDGHSAGLARGVVNQVGGLVGLNQGKISSSSSSDKVIEGSDSGEVGGLVGDNYGGRIKTSFSTGQVIARNEFIATGGFVGQNSGIVMNCYALGSVLRGSTVGGFVGLNDTGGQIRNSYSTGKVPARSGTVGGFAGTENGAAKSDYWDTTTSGTDVGVGSGLSSGVLGLTTEQFQSGLPAGFDPAMWAEDPNINSGFPYLRTNPPPK